MNREKAKWAPFESLFKSKEILKEFDEKRLLHEKPVLSEDELQDLESSLLEAYHTKRKIKVVYYYQGKDYEKEGIVCSIANHKVYFLDYSSLYLEQILKIKNANY